MVTVDADILGVKFGFGTPVSVWNQETNILNISKYLSERFQWICD